MIKRLFKKKKQHTPTRGNDPGDQRTIPTSLQHILSRLRNDFGTSQNFIVRPFTAGSKGQYKAAIAYIDGLANTHTINAHILKSMMLEAEQASQPTRSPRSLLDSIQRKLVTTSEADVVYDWETVVEEIASGGAALFIDDAFGCIVVSIPGWERRGVEEPVSESVVRGPRDGFTETLLTNETLIRRRIKNPRLWFEHMTIGTVTKTTISIAYLKGIADDDMVAEVCERLKRIHIDGILESGYLEEYIQDSTWSIFPLVMRTERPDIVSANLLEGRVAVLTDNTPFVLVVPVTFAQLLTSPEDYYERFPSGTLIRLLRYLSFLMSITLPAVYIAITTYHQELLPTDLVLAIAASRQGVPFPALVEALLMEIVFEILREAGIRLPRVIGQAVSIVGALVVGEAAVSAGLVSPAMVIVVATTAISSFSTPNFSFALSGRMLRFGFMFSASMLGLFGIQLAGLLLIIHVVSLRSFGVPYLEPYAPLRIDQLKDAILRLPVWFMKTRPSNLSRNDPVRQGGLTRWRPPADEYIEPQSDPNVSRGDEGHD